MDCAGQIRVGDFILADEGSMVPIRLAEGTIRGGSQFNYLAAGGGSCPNTYPGFMGIIIALGVNQTRGNICLVDNGSDAKWYAENLLENVYYYNKDPQSPYEPCARGVDPSEDA